MLREIIERIRIHTLARFLIVGLLLFMLSICIFKCGGRKRNYTTQDLVENYKTRSGQIESLEKYFNSIVPDSVLVDIEFVDDNTLGYFHVIKNNVHDNNWNIQINDQLVDSLLERLNWSRETLSTIKSNLDQANCISIRSGDPCNIGFRRRGSGEYFYNLFDAPIAENLRYNYNDSCTYILLNETVVLEYGGGTVGPQCFPDFLK